MNENKNSAKKSFFPKKVRIIALILAVLIIGELIFSQSVAVSFSSKKYADSPYEQAAEYIEENDSYLTANRLARMRAAVSTLGEPKTYDDFSQLASAAIADEDYAKAADYLLKAVDVCSDAGELPSVYLKIGCLMALDGKWDSAISYFDQSIALDDQNPDAHLMLTEAYLNAGEYEKALTALETYSSFKTLSQKEFDALIQLKINLGKYEDALASCDEAEKDGILEDADIALYRAQVFYMQEDWPKSLEQSQKCLRLGGDSLKAYSLIALCSEQAGDYETALNACLEIIDKDQADLAVYQQAAQDAYLLSDHDTVLRIGENALNKFGENDDTLIFKKWLGLSYFETNDLKNAETNLSAVIDSGETEPELYYLRGICEMGSEKYEEAVRDFTQSLSSAELTDEALYNRGLCYIRLGDTDAAAVDFQTVIDRDSDEELIAAICELLGINP